MNDVVQELVDLFGPTLIAATVGSRTRNLEDLTDDQIAKAEVLKQLWEHLVELNDGSTQTASMYLIGSPHNLDGQTFITAIREGVPIKRILGAAEYTCNDGWQ